MAKALPIALQNLNSTLSPQQNVLMAASLIIVLPVVAIGGVRAANAGEGLGVGVTAGSIRPRRSSTFISAL